MKAYVAGPFFNDDQVKSMERLEDVLKKAHVKMFRPRFDAGQIKNMKNATNQDLKDVFNEDIHGIDDCDFIIANLTYKDTGTAFELGYAFATNKPVVLFNEENISGKTVNLMLAAVADAYYDNIVDLSNALHTNKLESEITGERLDIE